MYRKEEWVTSATSIEVTPMASVIPGSKPGVRATCQLPRSFVSELLERMKPPWLLAIQMLSEARV
jgi:hypothetical protein